MTQEIDFDRNPALSDNYERAPRSFVPGYDASHTMAAVFLRDRIGERGRILVVGAGGRVELSVLARECQGWTFTFLMSTADLVQAVVKLLRVFAGTGCDVLFIKCERKIFC
jgi:hypothetical protein